MGEPTEESPKATGQRERTANLSMTAWVGIFTAILGVLAAATGTIIQGFMDVRLEKQKFESSMILKALDADAPEDAAKRLKFLVESGLITDPGRRISTLYADPKRVPTFATAMSRVAEATIKRFGTDIEEVQRLLKELGFFQGKVDGVFDIRTSKAILEFQKSKGLIPDGVLGRLTLTELQKSK